METTWELIQVCNVVKLENRKGDKTSRDSIRFHDKNNS